MPVPGQKSTVGSVLNKLIERVNSNIRRLRVVEQESSVIKTRLNSVEQEVIGQKNHSNRDLEKMNQKISSIDEKISSIDNIIKEIVTQLKKTITTSKIRELEELIDIYNPMKSKFITRDEMERMIEERLRERS